ncbi:hypothetical protein GC169_09090 [bacterium]|nr:hypothetical protein [bacterium]
MRAPVLAALVAVSPAAWAHHGWTAFDAGKQTDVTGVIEKVAFGNPHGELWLTVEGRSIYVELSPPARMVARGLTAEDLKIGSSVTVDAQPNLKDAAAWKAQAITVGDKTYSLMREPGGP